MSEREYPVPGFPDYFVKEDGTVISYRVSPEGRVLKPKITHMGKYTSRNRVMVQVGLAFPPDHPEYKPGYTRNIALHKIIASAKYGRWPEPYEEVRHMDGDHKNNTMGNLQLGDRINNVIDDYFLGNRETSLEYIDVAIDRLMALREKMEQEKSPSE